MRNSNVIQIVVKLGLILSVFGAAFFPFLTSNVDAQGKKTTPTLTITFSSTPTVTSTDSLNVFETPNTPTVDPLAIYVSGPIEGDTVSGVVEIKGKTDVLGFASQDVEFSYKANPADTWFLLSRSNQGVKNGSLALWDTNTISDGDYVIRLRVFFSDGSWRDTLVKGIKVRNYTVTQALVPTATKKLILTNLPAVTFTPTPSPSPQATPTLFPSNAAELPSWRIWSSLGRGAAVAIILFLIFGLLLRSRKKSP